MRKSKRFLFRCGAVTLACVVLATGLSSCGSADNPNAPTGSLNAKARKAHQQPGPDMQGQQDMSEMVAAVSASKAGPPVQLKFSLVSRPEVGQPVDISVALIPGAPGVDSLSASFQANEGLEIVEGAKTEKVDKPAPGVPVRHTLKILPKRDGIFAVTATVAADSSNETSLRTFSIPVIAGNGLADSAGKPISEGEGSVNAGASTPDGPGAGPAAAADINKGH